MNIFKGSTLCGRGKGGEAWTPLDHFYVKENNLRGKREHTHNLKITFYWIPFWNDRFALFLSWCPNIKIQIQRRTMSLKLLFLWLYFMPSELAEFQISSPSLCTTKTPSFLRWRRHMLHSDLLLLVCHIALSLLSYMTRLQSACMQRRWGAAPAVSADHMGFQP